MEKTVCSYVDMWTCGLTSGQWNHNPVGRPPPGLSALSQKALFFTLRSVGVEEQTALGWAVCCWLEYGQGEGPASSHYSWNRSRVNTRQPAIGHCADLRQETEQGWGWAARSGTGKKGQKKKRAFGRNSCAVVEVGIKNDAEQKGPFWGNSEGLEGWKTKSRRQ